MDADDPDQDAEACGVSRGTVDRVLNNRGRVREEIADRVREKAKEFGYRPNTAGKALAARKKNYVIGVILTSEGVEFFEEVLNGIQKGQEEACQQRLTAQIVKGEMFMVQSRRIGLKNDMSREVTWNNKDCMRKRKRRNERNEKYSDRHGGSQGPL